jgi:lysophospholipase L1-like esterase
MKSLLVNLGVALGSLLLFLGILEGGLRVAGVGPEESVNPMFSWRDKGELWLMQPGATWRTRAGNHPVHVNSLGLRDREIGPCDPAVRRILLLGDSVTFGHGQPIEVTVGRQIEAIFSDRDRRVQVINAGIAGWSTRQQLLFYREHGVRLCPDLVLVGFVLNDVKELHQGLLELGADRGLAATAAMSWLSQRTATFAALKQIYAWLLDPVSREIAVVEDLVRRADAPEVRHAMDLVAADLRELSGLAGARGDAFGLVLFPFRFQFLGDNLDAPQAYLRAFAAGNGIPVLDTLPILRRYPPDDVLMDHDHFTARGHRIVAEAVVEWIQRESLLSAGVGQPGIDATAAVKPGRSPSIR